MQLALQRAARLDCSRSFEPQRAVVDGLPAHSLAVCSLDGFVTPKRGGIAAERDAGNVVGQLEELAVRRITCREATCFCPSLFFFFFSLEACQRAPTFFIFH